LPAHWQNYLQPLTLALLTLSVVFQLLSLRSRRRAKRYHDEYLAAQREYDEYRATDQYDTNSIGTASSPRARTDINSNKGNTYHIKYEPYINPRDSGNGLSYREWYGPEVANDFFSDREPPPSGNH
jgi:hypothetical protein